MRRALVLVLLLAACGGSGSSSPGQPTAAQPAPSPSPTPPAAPVVRDGVSEGLVAEAAPAPPQPALNTPVTVRQAGFLTREQLYDGSPIFLWPGDEPYVEQLSYDSEFRDGTRRVTRWDTPVVVSLDGDLAQDPVALAKAEEVAAEIRRATGFSVAVGAGGNCVIALDPNILEQDDAVAIASLSYRGASITSARVRFWSRAEISGAGGSQYANTLLHEMGHVMGLGHSPSPRDVMTPGSGPGTREAVYQPGERACLHMAYAHRRAGNVFPDRDVALGAFSGLRWSREIAEGRAR